MPSFNVKLASLSSSLRKSFKKVTNKLSLKKNKDGKKQIFVVSASETREEIDIEVIAQPAVAVLPAEEPSRYLMVSTFALEDDEEEDEDQDEDAEEIIVFPRRDFEAEKKVVVCSVVKSILIAVDAIEESVEICNGPTTAITPIARPVRPSPLRQIAFTSPHSLLRPSSAAYFERPLPPLPTTTTDGRTTPDSTPLSTSSSLSSFKSSVGPSTPRGGSPVKNVDVVVQKQNRFAVYEPFEIRGDEFY